MFNYTCQHLILVKTRVVIVESNGNRSMISSLPGVFTHHVGNSPSMHFVLCTPFYLLGTTKKSNHIIVVATKREVFTQEEQSYIGNINKLRRTQLIPCSVRVK